MPTPMNLLRFKPPVIAIVLLGVSVLLHFLIPARLAGRFGMPWLGGIVFLTGFTIMISGWRLFRQASTAILPTGEPSHLVTKGPYRFTRNPMYLGVTLVLLGVAIHVGSIPMFLAPAVFAVIIHGVFIPHEESKMDRIFGQRYRDFKQRVRRWI